MKYIVTGTGRCGTVYAAKFLTSLGIPCGHETIFNWQGLEFAKKRLNKEYPRHLSGASKTTFNFGNPVHGDDWVDVDVIEAESSYMAAPYLDSDILKDVKIIHFVRHPSRVINSFCNFLGYFSKSSFTNIYERFIYSKFPVLQHEMSQYDRAALYYILWNKQIKSHFFQRLEDPKDDLMDFLGSKSDHFFDQKNANTFAKPSKKFQLCNLENKKIKSNLIDLGLEYGYDMNENKMVF